MNSKKTELELRSLGSYEVIFGVPQGAAVELKASRTASGSARPRLSRWLLLWGTKLIRQLADLRKQIEGVKRTVSRRSTNDSGPFWTGARAKEEIAARLLEADFSEDFATELATVIEADWRATSGEIAALAGRCEQRERECAAARMAECGNRE